MAKLVRVRTAINSIADGCYSQANQQMLLDFIGWEIYSKLCPSQKQPGDLFQWLVDHGYHEKTLKAWLFSGGVERSGIPVVAWGYAVCIINVLIHPEPRSCTCVEMMHSRKARRAAQRRCPPNHYLTRRNLDAYATSAPERVKAQFKKRKIDPPEGELAKAIRWHSDPINFVRRAVHGNSHRLSASQGACDFGHSMLCAIFETPQGSQLRIKRWNRKYILYDTRDGVCGDWKWVWLYCALCQRAIVDPVFHLCNHPLLRSEEVRHERPAETIEIDVAQCAAGCSADGNSRTIWLWSDEQKRCPICNEGRRRRRLRIVTTQDLDGSNEDDEYALKQLDEDIPSVADPELIDE